MRWISLIARPTASAGSSSRSAYHGSSSCTFPARAAVRRPWRTARVGGLAEVAALGVLEVRVPGCQRDFDIGQRRACQHARVGALGQVGQDQPLPVAVQRVGAAGRGQLHAAAARGRLQQQVHLGIMAQRFIMAEALHRAGQRLFIQNAAFVKPSLDAETVLQYALQNFQLHFAHQLQVHFAQRFLPDDMQLRVFGFQRAQRAQGGVHVGPGRQPQAVAQHRFQHRQRGVRLGPQALAGVGGAQAGDGHDIAGPGFADKAELAAGIHAQAGRLFRGKPRARRGGFPAYP